MLIAIETPGSRIPLPIAQSGLAIIYTTHYFYYRYVQRLHHHHTAIIIQHGYGMMRWSSPEAAGRWASKSKASGFVLVLICGVLYCAGVRYCTVPGARAGVRSRIQARKFPTVSRPAVFGMASQTPTRTIYLLMWYYYDSQLRDHELL